MWFAAFQQPQQNPWLFALMEKFLKNDELALSLISHNPFQGQKESEKALTKMAPKLAWYQNTLFNSLLVNKKRNGTGRLTR